MPFIWLFFLKTKQIKCLIFMLGLNCFNHWKFIECHHLFLGTYYRLIFLWTRNTITTSTSVVFILMFATAFGLMEQWVSWPGNSNCEKTFSALLREFSCFQFVVYLIITTFSCWSGKWVICLMYIICTVWRASTIWNANSSLGK